MNKKDIYERLTSGEPVNLHEPDYEPVRADMSVTRKLNFRINNEYHETEELTSLFSELFGEPLKEGTVIFTPFYVDLGKLIKLGKHVFINHNCTCLTAGGITIEDNVRIAPQVKLITANHDLDDRDTVVCKSIHIGENVWIGAGALILPGVTIGKNAVVAGGAVVTKNVEPNVVVGGNPAKVLKRLNK